MVNMTVFFLKKILFWKGLFVIKRASWTFCIVLLIENDVCVFIYFLRRVVMYYNPQEAVVCQEDCVLIMQNRTGRLLVISTLI